MGVIGHFRRRALTRSFHYRLKSRNSYFLQIWIESAFPAVSRGYTASMGLVSTVSHDPHNGPRCEAEAARRDSRRGGRAWAQNVPCGSRFKRKCWNLFYHSGMIESVTDTAAQTLTGAGDLQEPGRSHDRLVRSSATSQTAGIARSRTIQSKKFNERGV